LKSWGSLEAFGFEIDGFCEDLLGSFDGFVSLCLQAFFQLHSSIKPPFHPIHSVLNLSGVFLKSLSSLPSYCHLPKATFTFPKQQTSPQTLKQPSKPLVSFSHHPIPLLSHPIPFPLSSASLHSSQHKTIS
jgi:hypothetical protein